MSNLEKYYDSIENIDRACSTVIENSITIFLPFKRIDKTDIYKKFKKNNNVIDIENSFFKKVECKGRLLGQIHKDILEILLSMSENTTYSKDTARFKITTTAYEITKKLKKNIGKKQWIIKKIEEIAECRIKIFYTTLNNDNETFNFNFISSIRTVNENEIEINFTQEYTYFLIQNELLDYKNYIQSIMELEKDIKKIQRTYKKRRNLDGSGSYGLKRGINTEFIKSIVRYMLTHNGKNSQIGIDTLINKMKLNKIMSNRELEENLFDLRREQVQELLKNKFGITLTADKQTLTFNSIHPKYHIIKN